MLLYVVGDILSDLKKYSPQSLNKDGSLLWTANNTGPLGETKQLVSLLAGVKGKTIDLKHLPDPLPDDLKWRHQLFLTEAGADGAKEKVGEPLDLMKDPKVLGLRMGRVLWLQPTPPLASPPKPKPKPKNEPKSPPTPLAKTQPPTPQQAKPGPQPAKEAPEKEARKPSDVGKQDKQAASSPKKPDTSRSPSPARAKEAKEAPAPSASPKTPREVSMLPQAYAGGGGGGGGGGSQFADYLLQQLREVTSERDRLQGRVAGEADESRRRERMEEELSAMQRQRREAEAALERERAERREDELKQRERQLERQERELRHREQLAEDLAHRSSVLSSPPASPTPPLPAAPPAAPPELLLSLVALRADNRELHDMVRRLRRDMEESAKASRETAPPPPPSPPSLPPLHPTVHQLLHAAGLLERHGRAFAEQKMDEQALLNASSADLAELGLTHGEIVKLRAAVQPPQPQLQPMQSMQPMQYMQPPAVPRVPLSAADAAFHKSVLQPFFERHDAGKVGHVDFLVADLAGEVVSLYPALADAYGIPASPYVARVSEFLGPLRAPAAPILADMWRGREGELLEHITKQAPAWEEMYAPDGRAFYHSATFHVSQWVRPLSLVVSRAQHLLPAYSSQTLASMQGLQRTPSPSPPRTLRSSQQYYRAWTIAFLLKHDPTRVTEADQLLTQLSGPEVVDLLTREYTPGKR